MRPPFDVSRWDESNKLLFVFVGSIGGEISPFNDFFKDPKFNPNPNWTEPIFSVQAQSQTRTVPFGALGDGDGNGNDDGDNRGEIMMMEWLWKQNNNIRYEKLLMGGMMNGSEINDVNRIEVKSYQCEMMSMELWNEGKIINGMEARMEVKLLIKWRFAYI